MGGRRRRERVEPTEEWERLVVDPKAEYPGFNPNEISGAVWVRFGRRPDRKTVRRVLEEEPHPLTVRAPLSALPRDP
ncbi:MAG: hypothetical protein ACRDTR_17555 [Rubrobacter sp.]